MKISADIIEKDVRRDEGGIGELEIKFKPKHRNYVLPFPDVSTASWRSVKYEVLKKCGLSPDSQVSICYIDEENDKVRVDSDAEYHEALRVGQKCGNKLKIVVKELGSDEQNIVQHSSGETFSYRELESGEFVVMDKLPYVQSDCEPIYDQSVKQKALEVEEIGGASAKQESGIESWLKSYTVQLKDDLVKEVSDKVFERVMLMMGNTNLSTPPDAEQKASYQKADRNDAVLHVGIICDNCETPIRGIRYKCRYCKDYDLCEQCESLPHIHNEKHSFLKIHHNVYDQIYEFGSSAEHTVSKHSPSRRSSNAAKSTVSRNSLGIKYRKEEKLMKVFRKLEKYRAKEQSFSSSRTVSPVIRQQVHLDRQVDSRRTESLRINCSRHHSRNSEFIKDETFPDGTSVIPGAKFCKSWRMRNTGSKPFTSDTVLKHTWGGKKLVPEKMEVAVPSLLPGQEGIISVMFTAPTEPGSYISHWRLSHRGVGFGDRVWCIVEVHELPSTDKVKEHDAQKSAMETDEKCTIKQNNVQEGIAQVLNAVQEEQQRGDTVGRKTAIVSHTATPTNTPFDLSPPKSPEPQMAETSASLKETKLSSVKEVDALLCPELHSSQTENYTTGSESDDTISVLNLNSSESDTEFVIVPMPLCCSMDIPLVPSSLHQGINGYFPDEHMAATAGLSETCSAPSTRRASVERAATPSSLPSICVCSSKESNSSASPVSSSCSVSEETGTPENAMHSNVTEGQNLIQLDQIPLAADSQRETSINTATSSPSEVPNTTVHSSYACTEEQNKGTESPSQNDSCTAEASNVRNENTDNEERMVQVLPEGLVNGALTAAASVYNTARAVITGMQGRNEPWNDDWRAPSTYPPPTQSSPMMQLIEMGFCNRALNHHLLIKYKGHVEEVVAELVSNHDNDWYNHRHSSSYLINFD